MVPGFTFGPRPATVVGWRPLSSVGQTAEAVYCPRPLWHSQPRPARRGALGARSGRSPRPELMWRRDWWRLTGGLGGRRWPAQASGDYGACAGQGEGWWVSSRWRGTIEVAEQRWHGGLPAAVMPLGGQWQRGQVLGDQREREHNEVLPFWLGEGDHEAHRRGKRAVVLQRNSDEGSGASALSTDARALQRGEEGGVVELQCRARPRNEREWRRPSTAFDRKEKGKWGGGGPAWAVPRGGRKGPWLDHAMRRRTAWGPGSWQGT
jgi:hypothetical protein